MTKNIIYAVIILLLSLTVWAEIDYSTISLGVPIMVKLILTLGSIVALLVLSVRVAHGVELVGKDKIFIRFTNIRPGDSRILVRLNIVPNHNQPFSWNGKTVYIGNDGEGEKTEEERYLSSGQASPWVDVGQYMNLQGTRSWDTYLSPLLCGVMIDPQADGLYLLAEVAQGRGTRIVRRLEIKKPELPAVAEQREYPWLLGYGCWNGSRPFLPTLGLLVPSNPDILPRIYTLEEAMRWQLDVIEEFPDVGRQPTLFSFRTNGRPEVLGAFGYNDYPKDVITDNFGDEISIKVNMPEEEQNERFRKYMKERGFDPLGLMSDENAQKAKVLPETAKWELVTVTPALPEKPVQFYESAIFRYRLWYEEMKARTDEIIEENPGRKVWTGANFSPHMNVWPDVRQWVGPFKAGAMTMTWTEDWWWQLPEVSPQVYGFLLDGLRLAGSYHGAPMQYYIMPFKGNSADNFRRQHGLALSHGAKIINHFHTQAQVLTTWDYIDICESPRTYQAIHDMIRDVGAVEHRLYPAMPEKAEVAIMLSWASDTWDTEELGGAGHLYGAKYNVNNDERKALWMALRHEQYPVDLITDEDIAEGKLKKYRVLYIVGSEMLNAAAEPIKTWVREGGILYATGGGGLLDEYHRPLETLHEMYGIEAHELVRNTRHIRPRETLPKSEPLDTLLMEQEGNVIEFPTLLYRETLEPAKGSEVVGRYKSDNAPAAVFHRYGKGMTFYLGVLAGIAYLTPAIPPSSQMLPTEFPEALRSLITAPVRWANVLPPVKTSNPLVEAQYMAGENGACVVLTNWRQEPVEELIVEFPGKPDIRLVRSLRAAGYFKGQLHEQERGVLEVEVINGVPQVNMCLEVVDVLLVD